MKLNELLQLKNKYSSFTSPKQNTSKSWRTSTKRRRTRRIVIILGIMVWIVIIISFGKDINYVILLFVIDFRNITSDYYSTGFQFLYVFFIFRHTKTADSVTQQGYDDSNTNTLFFKSLLAQGYVLIIKNNLLGDLP